MPSYRVRPGFRHGMGNKYGPGDIVEHTEEEAAGFLDKLELVKEAEAVEEAEITPPSNPLAPGPSELGAEPVTIEIINNGPNSAANFDVTGSTVDQVIDAVKQGQISAEYALEQEQASDKPRTSLLSFLSSAIDDEE